MSDISYKTIKLKDADTLTVAGADPVDELYMFAPSAESPDRSQLIDKSKLKNLLCLDSYSFSQSRFFVDRMGGVWQGYYAMTRSKDNSKAVENFVGYERYDGDNDPGKHTDIDYRIAPEDIGNAFKDVDGGTEFTTFINAIWGHYQEDFKTLTDKLKGNELAAADMNLTGVTKALADPTTTNVTDIVSMLYTNKVITDNQALVDHVDLYQRYLQEALRLHAITPETYGLANDVAPYDLSNLKPAEKVQAATPNETATAPQVDAVEVAAPTPTPAPQTAAIPVATPVSRVEIIIDSPDLGIINDDLAMLESNGLQPSTSDGDSLSHVDKDKKGKKIVDQNGDPVTLKGKTFAYTTDGVRSLHITLLNLIKAHDPEAYYGIAISSSEFKKDSGFINFPESSYDLQLATNTQRLDTQIEQLKKANPDDLSYVNIIGYASATGETVIDNGKPVVITADTYDKNKKLVRPGNIGKYIDSQTNDLKPGYTWANGHTPPTDSKNAANKSMWAPKRIVALKKYLLQKGVSQAIIDKATLISKGGAYVPTARLEFAYKVKKDFHITSNDFSDAIPKSVALYGFLAALNPYLGTAAKIAEDSALSDATKKSRTIAAATEVEGYLKNTTNFDGNKDLASNIAHQLFTKLDAERNLAPGCAELADIISASFPSE